MAMGVSIDIVDESCPNDLIPYEEAYKLRIKEQNSMAYLQGRYFVHALLCTVGNMFSGKGAEKFEYPKAPIELDQSKIDENGLTEEEKLRQTEQLFNALIAAKINFDAQKKIDKIREEKQDG